MPAWISSETIDWTQIILDSYRQLLGKDLILDRSASPLDQARFLDHAPRDRKSVV